MKMINRFLSFVFERLSLNAFVREDYERAEKYLRLQERYDSHSLRFLHNLARIRLGQKSYEEACLLFESELSIIGESAELCRTLGDLYYLLGKTDKVQFFYTKALQNIAKTDHEYMVERLRLCQDEKRFPLTQMAQKFFEKGVDFLARNEWEEALAFFEQASLNDPTHYLALNNAGVIYLNHVKDKTQAKSCFLKSQRLFPLSMTNYNIHLCEESAS